MSEKTTYEDLKKKFESDVADLQERCDHPETTWMEKAWAPGHSTGKAVEICDICNKEIREIPLGEAVERGYLEREKTLLNSGKVRADVKEGTE